MRRPLCVTIRIERWRALHPGEMHKGKSYKQVR